jgi:hypothetical protein
MKYFRPPSPIIEVVPVAQYEAMYPSARTPVHDTSFQDYATYGGVVYPIYNTSGRQSRAQDVHVGQPLPPRGHQEGSLPPLQQQHLLQQQQQQQRANLYGGAYLPQQQQAPRPQQPPQQESISRNFV